MSTGRRRAGALALVHALCAAHVAGCYDHHGRHHDATVDTGISADAALRCVVDGWPAAELRNARPDLVGCECPAGELTLIDIVAPAEAARDGSIGLCAVDDRASMAAGALCGSGEAAYVDADGAAESEGFLFGGHGCLPPALCLYTESLMPAELRERCLYDDFTPVLTGEIPQISTSECASLRSEGLCGNGCGCAADEQCRGFSEQHRVGYCARPAICFVGSMHACRTWADEVCVMPLSRPDFFDRSSLAIPWGDGGSTRAGMCAPRATCTALLAAVPGVWECVDPP